MAFLKLGGQAAELRSNIRDDAASPARHDNEAATRPSAGGDAITAAALALVDAITLQLGHAASRPVVLATATAATRSALVQRGVAKGAAALNDGRVREWHIKAAIWSADNGREVDRLEWEGETTAAGLDGVAERLRDAALHVFTRGRWGGLPDDMRVHVLADKLGNMRPALSRNGGRANMRYKFDTGRDGAPGEAAYLQATITRADVAAHIADAAELRTPEDARNDAATAAIRQSGRLPYGPEIDAE